MKNKNAKILYPIAVCAILLSALLLLGCFFVHHGCAEEDGCALCAYQSALRLAQIALPAMAALIGTLLALIFHVFSGRGPEALWTPVKLHTKLSD